METVALNFDYMRHKMLPLGEALGIATTRERRGFQDSQRCSRQPSTCRHITRFYPALFKWKKFCYTYSIIDTCRFILLSTVFSTNYPHLWTGSSSSRKKRKKKTTMKEEHLSTPKSTWEGLHRAYTWFVTLTRPNRLPSKEKKKNQQQSPQVLLESQM